MIGLEIKIRRNATGKSVRTLAKECNISAGFLSNIENGTRRCTVSTARELDRVFDTGTYFVALAHQSVGARLHPSMIQEGDDVKRRTFMSTALVTGAVSATAMTMPDMAHAAHFAEGGSSTSGTIVSGSHVTAIRSFSAALTAADETSGGGIGRTAVDQFYASDIDKLIASDFDSTEVKRDAFALASEVAFLCAWKAHDIGREAAALKYYDDALKLARESKVPGADAFVLWGKAVQSYDTVTVSSAKDSLSWAKEGAAAAKDLGGHTQALMETTVARIHAESGNHSAARKALARVEDQLNTDMVGDDPGIVGIWCPHKANVLNQAGRVVGVLGAWDEAVEYTTAARDLWNRDTHARAWGMDTYLVGHALYKSGDEAGAESAWRDSLDVMTTMDSKRCRDLIDEIDGYMPHLVAEAGTR